MLDTCRRDTLKVPHAVYTLQTRYPDLVTRLMLLAPAGLPINGYSANVYMTLVRVVSMFRWLVARCMLVIATQHARCSNTVDCAIPSPPDSQRQKFGGAPICRRCCDEVRLLSPQLVHTVFVPMA